MKNIEDYEETNLEETKNMFENRKESYSSAFLELLNSEVIEDSPKNKQSEQEINLSSNIDDNNKSIDNNNEELSWNLITDHLMKNQTLSE